MDDTSKKIRYAKNYGKIFREPTPCFIGRSDDTERLYKLEENRTQLIKEIAKEYQRLWTKRFGTEIDLWEEAIPQVLFDTLESMIGGHRAARAYIKYLEEKELKDESGT
jgi:hypothetical protein